MEVDHVSPDETAPTIPGADGQSTSEPQPVSPRKKDIRKEVEDYVMLQKKRWVKLWQTKIGSELPHEIEKKTDLCAKLKELIIKCGRDSLPGKIPPFFLLLCCYGIQHDLRKRGRSDSIFYDEEYERFVQELTEYLTDNEVSNRTAETEGLKRGAIWDRFLYEIRELGGTRPEIMLFTLIYYNFKYFYKTEYDQHANLTFDNYEIRKEIRGSKEVSCLWLDGKKANSKRGEREPAAQYFREVFQSYKLKCPGGAGPFYKQWKGRLSIENDKKNDLLKWFLEDRLPEEQLKRMLARAKTIGWDQTLPDELEARIQRSIKTSKLVYKMDYREKGLAVIFDQENFTIRKTKPRRGTEVDVARLREVLGKVGFDVKVRKDLNDEEIQKEIGLFKDADFSERSCLMVIVLTHGNYYGEVAANDRFYDPAFLWESFTADKVLSLADKPKIFLIQACRGDYAEEGFSPGTRKRRHAVETDGAIYSTRISALADFLVAFSCSPGYASVRDPNKGTWFMQAFCSVLEDNHGTEDLLSMMTMVCDTVSDVEVFSPRDEELHGKKQTPVLQSTLRKKIYFNDNGKVVDSEEESG